MRRFRGSGVRGCRSAPTIGRMTLPITDDHRALAEVVQALLSDHGALGVARDLLDGADDGLPASWKDIAELGWLGIHLDEADGGSGFGVEELAVIVEQFGAAVCPGPFVPTTIASAVLAAVAEPGLRSRLVPGLANGSTVAAVALSADLRIGDGRASGALGPVVSGGLAQLVLAPAGDDLVIVTTDVAGVTVEVPQNLDPTRPAARVTLDGAAVDVVPDGARALVDLARLLFAAEAVGMARACTESAAGYAKERHQFGRPIATFQAVKHHCANMAVATEMATGAVWDAARAAAAGGDQLSLAAAMAATLALPAADRCAQLNIQVHGGIGFTWEHDAHLYLRRATAVESIVDAEAAANDVVDLVRAGVRRERSVDLPPEAEPIRAAVREVVTTVEGLDDDARLPALLDSGYAVPHWPAPWGRDAGAVEQLVIEQEFSAAGISRPSYSITGWVILTLVQQATEDQIARWVRPALEQEVIWCQLFSEPDAGSDAAAVKTRATRVDGGWLVNGQKVWTSGAHEAGFGLATVRTDPDAAKHDGITTMVVDMHADGVEVRPIRMPTGDSDFNEVFFDDVFVPDDDVVGPVNGGWTVARATLGNESVSIGGGGGGMAYPGEALVEPLDAHPERIAGGSGQVGRYIARAAGVEVLNLRSAHRAVAGAEPGPEGAVTKLVLSENLEEAAAILVALTGPETAFLDGPGALSGHLALIHRALAIAGGTSEIKRNQIGERILGLPRDPLVK